MLFCETAGVGPDAAEDLAIFVSQLAALGAPAGIAVDSVPQGMRTNLQFDFAPHLASGGLRSGDTLALLAADQLTDDVLVRLRRQAICVEVTARAFGRFARREAALEVSARLADALGREPELFDVSPADSNARCPAPAFGVPRRTSSRWQTEAKAPPRLLLVGPDLEDSVQAATLAALGRRRSLRAVVLTTSKAKQAWIAAHGRDIPFFHYGEIPPVTLAERTDLCIFFAGISRSYRLQCLVANLLVNGTALLDGSANHSLAKHNDALIPGPPGNLGLVSFLDAEILPNLGQIADVVRASRAAGAASAEPVLRFLGTGAEPKRPSRRLAPAKPPAGDIIFVPTNGIGLGHTQRCALIAGALSPARPRPVFAAFPSCMGMVKSHGFDVMPLVSRSPSHAQSHEHDLANYLRLLALSGTARALVFDGGYISESVYRTVVEGDVAGIWIRRGLWQRGKDTSVALDREKAFARVIVPSEAFDELNASYSQGEHICVVGPVVQQVSLSPGSRGKLRARLADRYGRSFDRLAVSLLGAGVVVDRRIQIQALCGIFERRSDTLHLVLVWPSTTLEPGWFSWRNSRVVRTQHAAVLAAAADLAVSAAGYNSFNEALYNRIPAIFVPQVETQLDDQRARARAACDRRLAAMLEANELMKLEGLIARYFDDGEAEAVRARLAAAELPEPGTVRAAQLIEEVVYGDPVERTGVPDRSAGRR
jgi:Glycosyltransferase family 28 C-terminal domain